MMSKEAKKNYIEEMKKNFSANESVMIAQYQGLNVNELDSLRKELREKGILFKITKNRITKIAIKETPVKELEKYFTGPTAAALSSDPITTAKILTKFAKTHQKLNVNIISNNKYLFKDLRRIEILTNNLTINFKKDHDSIGINLDTNLIFKILSNFSEKK